MKRVVFYIMVCFWGISAFAQRDFHVFPKTNNETPGRSTGDGSLQHPWDLQTALEQSSKVVNGGDTIWIHEGIYKGRYTSTLTSTAANKFITVAPYEDDKVTLNGNIRSSKKQVLEVSGNNIVFKDLEITWLGDFTRKESDTGFLKCDGVNHNKGKNVKFYGLIIHNNPGSGFGSWKHTSNAEINGCLIYNNGYFSRKRGRGVGIYVQNLSDAVRLIKNNVIFNNYYKGIEVWSDNVKAGSEYVKNVSLENNVIFNSGLTSGPYRDNIIIASNDRNGINIAKNIVVKNNILYHNTSLGYTIENSDAPSLTLGFNVKAPVENITVSNNIIIGRKNALRLLHARSLNFKNNIVYSGYARLNKLTVKHIDPSNWDFKNNTYYTRNNKPIRIEGEKDFNLQDWNKTYAMDANSKYLSYKDLQLKPVLNITPSESKKNQYRVVLVNKDKEDVTVNLSEFDIEQGQAYTIRDVEDYHNVIKSGTLEADSQITIPMKTLKPSKMKTFDNFGVFIIEFNEVSTVVEEISRDNMFKRFFRFLGF